MPKGKAARNDMADRRNAEDNPQKQDAPILSQAGANGAPGVMPLFFRSPEVINNERHRYAGIRQSEGMEFARHTNSIFITAAELVEAARYYPVVFTLSDPIVPVAIVGLEQSNYFVGPDGKWAADTYIPAYARQYPFVFLETPESDRLTLCIDTASPHFIADAKKEATGRLFDDDGNSSEIISQALEFCAAVQEQHLQARRFCNKLTELDLLVPQQMEAKLASGRIIRLGGFQGIDPQRLQALSGEALADLHKDGFLALAFYVALSAGNWRLLVKQEEKTNAR